MIHHLIETILVAIVSAYGYYTFTNNIWYRNAQFFQKIIIKPYIIIGMVFLIFIQSLLEIIMLFGMWQDFVTSNVFGLLLSYSYMVIFPATGFIFFWLALKPKNQNYLPNKVAMVAFLSLLPTILKHAILYIWAVLFSEML